MVLRKDVECVEAVKEGEAGGWGGEGRGGEGTHFEEVGVTGLVKVDVGVGGVFGLVW